MLCKHKRVACRRTAFHLVHRQAAYKACERFRDVCMGLARLQVLHVHAGSKANSQKAWESGAGGSFKGPAADAPVEVITYADSPSDHVAPVSPESAQAAFNDACGDSFQRREGIAHPGMHIGKSGLPTPDFL